jgi:hypothetical protein
MKGLRKESNYDYSKLKRKGKERERKASCSTINTRCVCAPAAPLPTILKTWITQEAEGVGIQLDHRNKRKSMLQIHPQTNTQSLTLT